MFKKFNAFFKENALYTTTIIAKHNTSFICNIVVKSMIVDSITIYTLILLCQKRVIIAKTLFANYQVNSVLAIITRVILDTVVLSCSGILR